MCCSPQAANIMPGICFPWYRFVFYFLRNILDKRGQRGGRCTWCRHSHHQRWGQPRTHRRKERILHLDCRGSYKKLSPSHSPFQSLYIVFPLSVSPFAFPPPTTASVVSIRNPQRVKRGSPSVFLLLPFLLFTSCLFFLLAASVHRQLAGTAKVLLCFIMFLICDVNAWKSAYLLLTWALVHPLSWFPLSRHPDTFSFPFVHTP